jgi:hypothetical protein
VRERDDDVELLLQQPVQLVLGLGEPARGNRGTLRVERERLALRQRSELGRTRELDRREALVSPHRAHFVGRPDEVGRPLERRHEVGRYVDLRRVLELVVQQRHFDELVPALGRGIDRRRLDLAKSALRERREGADLLDLVTEELDPQRLAAGGREDVDQAAADGELPPLLDALDPLVPR